MKVRGKVLREPAAGPGLIMAEGKQYPFPLEGVWKSETLPRAGLPVEVELSAEGTVVSAVPVPEAQLAREQAEQALAAARARGGALAASAVARFGMPTLVAVGLLVLGWFFLSTLSVNAGFAGKIDLTFWRILAFVNSGGALEGMRSLQGGGSAGLYGLLAIASLAGPFVGYFWKDRRALLLGALPLLFMLLVALLVRNSLASAAGDVPAQFLAEARSEIAKQLSVGMGAYASLLAAAYLALSSVRKFLVARAHA